MATKIHTHTNPKTNISVNYRHAGKGHWLFTSPSGLWFKTPGVNGKEMAEKVAGHVAGALNRTGGKGIDGLARANISALTA